MLKKAKDIGTQIGNKAVETVEEIGNAVKSGVEHITHSTSETASNASDKAIRTAIEQMRNMLNITLDELKNKPISEQPATITASITIGIVSLQIEVATPEQVKQSETSDLLPKETTSLT